MCYQCVLVYVSVKLQLIVLSNFYSYSCLKHCNVFFLFCVQFTSFHLLINGNCTYVPDTNIIVHVVSVIDLLSQALQ
jgi:hypothetical protein